MRQLLLVAVLCAPVFALDTSQLHRSGYVNDFAHVITTPDAKTLESYCSVLEGSSGAEIVIVTVDSLDGEDISTAANRVFNQWGIGTKGRDDGILLLLSIKDRQDRAEVGYGLEPIVTDVDAGSILRGIRPILRQGTYGPALIAALQQFGAKIDVAKDNPSAGAGGSPHKAIPYWIVALAMYLIISSILWLADRRRGGISGFLFGTMKKRRRWIAGGFGDTTGSYNGGGRGEGWGGGGFGGGRSSGGAGASGTW